MSGTPRRRLWSAYRPPLLLGLVAIAGLVAALVGDGVYDAASWVALGILVAVVVIYGRR